MSYMALDEAGVVQYIQTRPAMKEILPDMTDLSVTEVGDGNLNMVFIRQPNWSFR